MNEKGQVEWVTGALAVLFVILLGFIMFTATVPAGNQGVQDTFGSVSNDTLASGFHVKGPFTGVISMNLKTVQVQEKASVPTNEGLIVDLDTTVMYHLDSTKVVDIYKTIGVNYQDVLVVPTVRSAIREVTSKYEAKALYSSNRDFLAMEIEQKISPSLATRGIVVEQVLLRDLGLPRGMVRVESPQAP